jgi:hypothetical protein
MNDINHDVKNCNEDECTICGIINCPFGEPLHFHHDGCPACFDASNQEYVAMSQTCWNKNKLRFVMERIKLGDDKHGKNKS